MTNRPEEGLKMVVWKLTGDEIGQNGTAALYCATKQQALGLLREYRQWCKEKGYQRDPQGPEKIVVRNREDLCMELNHATGYGST
jgi:hypothetical protein